LKGLLLEGRGREVEGRGKRRLNVMKKTEREDVRRVHEDGAKPTEATLKLKSGKIIKGKKKIRGNGRGINEAS